MTAEGQRRRRAMMAPVRMPDRLASLAMTRFLAFRLPIASLRSR
jgi:hypothetical protein